MCTCDRRESCEEGAGRTAEGKQTASPPRALSPGEKGGTGCLLDLARMLYWRLATASLRDPWDALNPGDCTVLRIVARPG